MHEQVLNLLQEKRFTTLKSLLQTTNPADIALLTKELPEEYLPLLFRILPKELASDTFVNMEPDMQELLIKTFSDSELKAVLDDLFLDDTVDIIEEMPANVVKRILRHTDPERRKMINQVLNYPKDSAGSIMTIEYVDLKKDMTVADAFTRIRKTGLDKETIYTCYVTNPYRKLIGLVSVKTLLLSAGDQIIGDIMETNLIYVDTLVDKEDVAHMFDKYDFLALPVVDQEKRLVGIITVDDAMDVIQEENTEDFTKMAAMSPIDESYFRASVWHHAKNRIVWLLLLMLSATLTGIIITRYEKAFEAIPLLVAFIPMLMDTGGNCGSQSATMIIRGLALDEIHPKDIFKVMFKECRIALIVGFALTLVNTLRIIIMYHKSTQVHAYVLALVLGITLMATILLAKMIGCILPIAAKKLRLDPAIMAAPLITTIVDTCSVLIFFNVAMAFMDALIKI